MQCLPTPTSNSYYALICLRLHRNDMRLHSTLRYAAHARYISQTNYAAVAQWLKASNIFRQICKSTSEWRGFLPTDSISGFEFAKTPLQWTLSISNTLYLELFSISNNFLCPLDISIDSSLIFSLYLEPPYLELLFISNKNVGPMQMFLSLSRTLKPSHSL